MDTFREFLQPVGGTDIGYGYTDRKGRNGYIGDVARDHPEDAGGSRTVDLADRYLTSAAVGLVGCISQQSDQRNDQADDTADEDGVAELTVALILSGQTHFIHRSFHYFIRHCICQDLVNLCDIVRCHIVHLYQDIFRRGNTTRLHVVEENRSTGIGTFDGADTEVIIDTANGVYLISITMFGYHHTFTNSTSCPARHLLHLFDKTTANHYFIAVSLTLAESVALQNRYLHQFKIIITDAVHIGNVKQFAVITRQTDIITRRIFERQLATGRHQVDLWQTAQFVHRPLTLLGTHPAGITKDQILVSVAGITRNHSIILAVNRDQ